MPDEYNTNSLCVDEQSLSIHEFYYSFFIRFSWLPCKVEKLTYLGNMEWERRVSLDIDLGHIKEVYSHVSAPQPGDTSATKASEPQAKSPCSISIPFATLRKTEQMNAFDLRDREGRSLKLIEQTTCANYCLAILIGSMLDDGDLVKNADMSPDRSSREELMTDKELAGEILENSILLAILLDIFLPELPDELYDATLSKERMDVQKRLEAEMRAIRTFFELNFLKIEETVKQGRAPGVTEKDLSDAKNLFGELFEQSVRFRYFLHLFSYNKLLITTIDAEDSRNSLLKYRMVQSRDVVNERTQGPSKNRVVGRMRGFRLLDIPFDAFPHGDHYHLLVSPPDGTRFGMRDSTLEKQKPLPEKLKSWLKKWKSETDYARPFVMLNSGGSFAAQADSQNNSTHYQAFHEQNNATRSNFILTENWAIVDDCDNRHIAIEARPRRKQDNTPVRRVPDGNQPIDNRCVIRMKILPSFEKQAKFYLIVFLLSLFSWLFILSITALENELDYLDYCSFLVSIIVPIVVLYFTVFREDNYFSSRLYRPAFYLAMICVVASCILFLLFLYTNPRIESCVLGDFPLILKNIEKAIVDLLGAISFVDSSSYNFPAYCSSDGSVISFLGVLVSFGACVLYCAWLIYIYCQLRHSDLGCKRRKKSNSEKH